MKKPQAFVGFGLSALVVGWIVYSFIYAYQPEPIRIQGQIEAEQYSISSKVPGRIERVLVKKGDQVEPGQLIFTIYSPELDAKLEQAKAGQEAAGAMAEEAERGARTQQISAAMSQWKKASAAKDLLEKTYLRVNNLYEDGVVSEQKRDEAFTQWQAAQYTEDAAYQMYQLTNEGVREETKRAAFEKVRMATGAVAEVEAYTADTHIKSWYSGEISQVLLHSGELAPQGFPVATVVDMKDAWAVFNVREDRLSRFAKGTRFIAKVPALNKEIEFEVNHIAVMGDFATWRSTDVGQGFDMRTFSVEARPSKSVSGLRVGMSVLLELE